MGSYVLTGGATGIGAAVREQLLSSGHEVFSVDVREADFQADLTDPQQRRSAVAAIEGRFAGGIDGFIACAGIGPHTKPLSLIPRVNFFAAKEMTLALMPLLEERAGSVVLISSNSASMPGLNKDYIGALLEGNEQQACEIIEALDGHNAYAGSKNALTRWMRRNNAVWATKGVRVNAVAPGITRTPLTDQVLQDKGFGEFLKEFAQTVPLGRIAEPDEMANVIMFLLSEQASFVSGSVLFVDGGHDAMLRPDEF